MTTVPKPRLQVVVESYVPRGKGCRFVRIALRDTHRGGDIFQADLDLDEARTVLDDLVRALEP